MYRALLVLFVGTAVAQYNPNSVVDAYSQGVRDRIEREKLDLQKQQLEMEKARRASSTKATEAEASLAIAELRNRYPDFDKQQMRIASLMKLFVPGPSKDATMVKYLEGLYLIAKFASFAGAEGTPTAESSKNQPKLSNDDIVKLVKAGFGQDLIVSKIRSSTADFKLEPDHLLELKRAEVPEAIIGAMITSQAGL